jgi:quercetin dioxygenase-like cupin family protein
MPETKRRLVMRWKLTFLVFCSAAIGIAGFYHTETVLATPANSGFTAVTIARGTFGEFEVFNQVTKDSLPAGFEGNVWLSLQKTKGKSDLYVQSNAWQPGGSTGWHTHPGHSLIIITAGTVTAYDADCTRHEFGVGGTLDLGGDHVHLIRNEGSVLATGVAVQLVPAGAARRIDAPAPEGCESIL